MRTTMITTDEIMSWGPCPAWPRERVAAYVGEGMRPAEFLTASGLTDEELDWVLNRREVLTDAEMRTVIASAPSAILPEPQYADTLGDPFGLGGLETVSETLGDDSLQVLDDTTQGAEPDPEPAPGFALQDWPDALGAMFATRRAFGSEALVAALRTVAEGS